MASFLDRIQQQARQGAMQDQLAPPVAGQRPAGQGFVDETGPTPFYDETRGPIGTLAGAKAPPTLASPSPVAQPSSGFDGSGYGTASGYLQGATKWFQSQVQAAKSEAEAKSLVQNFLQSLAPELEKRGGKFGGAKNETITLDGREYDMFRDIGGASEAQMLEMGLGGPATPPTSLGALIGGGSDPMNAGPQLQTQPVGSSETLKQILDQLAQGNAAQPQQPPPVQAVRNIRTDARRSALSDALGV